MGCIFGRYTNIYCEHTDYELYGFYGKHDYPISICCGILCNSHDRLCKYHKRHKEEIQMYKIIYVKEPECNCYIKS